MAYIYDLTDTWNAGGTTFNGIKLNVTDSASAVSSKLVTLQTNGTEHFSVTKAGVGYFSGNVGIGTSSPAAKLDVLVADGAEATKLRGATGRMRVRPYVDATNGSFIDAVNTAENAYIPLSLAGSSIRLTTNVGLAATIDSSGNLLVGVTGSIFPTAGRTNIEVNGSSQALFGMGVGNTGAAYFLHDGTNMDVFQSRNGYMRFGTNNTERMRIDASGNLLVGTTSVGLSNTNSLVLDPGNGYLITNHSGTASGTAYAFFGYNGSSIGTITQNGTTGVLYNTSSDVRLKDNITDADDAASLIDAIQVRKFDWKSDGSHQRYGFVAQELLEVAPEAVSHDPDDDAKFMGVDYSKLVPMLVKEIQSLRARVAQLEGTA